MKTARFLTSVPLFVALAGLSRTSAAANICNETVPANRYVDGLPAYAQCPDSTNASIWSNNGIDTSTASGGAGWVRTQGSGGYQCTEWARRYLLFRWKIDYQGGNGGEWCDGNLPATLVKTTIPMHGDLMVFAPGACGAAAVTGHIAVVDTVNTAAATVSMVEENSANRRSCAISTATCFLHATANDGSTIDAGAPDSAIPDAGAGGAAGRGGAGGAAGTAGASGAGAGGAGLGGGGAGGSGAGGAGAGGPDAGGAGAGGAGAGAGVGGMAGMAGNAMAGTGGAFMDGGQPSVPGASGTGGTAGAGGTMGTGGTAAGTGGAASERSNTPEPIGCSCRVATRPIAGVPVGVLLALSLSGFWAWRRHGRRRPILPAGSRR